MKKLLFSIVTILIATGAFAQVKSDDIAKIKVETIDLGKVPQNIPAVSTFIVTNIGKTDLIIESASPTCGCTVGDYTKTPIKPGKTGTITATYNAATLGPINKHMIVKFAGAEDSKNIGFTGEVLTTEEYAKMKAGIPAAIAAVSTPPAKTTTTPLAAAKPKVKGKRNKKSCVNC
jgi:hypothetical protein